ncbi:Uncharacterised protein [Proteus mirabilis]|uniref:Uncharacterized protein n=1 Tax=Proteus mirabilis TaxID=584 RepID=A0A2X2C2P4_PROMI|nr:Uncharacterised protein [Proteus mirabilis]
MDIIVLWSMTKETELAGKTTPYIAPLKDGFYDAPDNLIKGTYTIFIIKIKNIYYIYTNNQPYTFIMKIFYIYYIAIHNIDLATILIISSIIKNKTTNN